jgi:hypothetical protein
MVTRTRYRCAACGNLTRFDVEARRHTRQFIHYSLAGEPTVEEEDVIDEQIEKVTCRWCGSSDQIETIPAVEAQEEAQ